MAEKHVVIRMLFCFIIFPMMQVDKLQGIEADLCNNEMYLLSCVDLEMIVR